MKKLNELMQSRAAINDQINDIIAADELTDEQRAQVTELEGKVDSLKEEIEFLKRQEERNAEMASVNIVESNTKDDETGSNLVRSLNELFTTGHITSDYRGKEGFVIPSTIFRADPILTTTNTGIINKVVDPTVSIKRSYGEQFLRDLGVRFYEGVTGNLVLPSMAETTATLTAESGTATSASQAPTSNTLSAKRIDVVQGYNREFLAQTSVYDSLLQDLVDSIGVQMVYTFFDNMATDAVDASVAGTTAGVTYSDVLGLEKNLADVMGDIKFVGTPAFKQYLKNLNASSANIKFAWGDDNTLLGLPAMAANGVNANQLWLGDWSKSAQAMFGDMEIIVDPYSVKKSGKVEVYAVQLADSGTSNYRHFSWITDGSIGV